MPRACTPVNWDQEPELLTSEDLARILGPSESTCYRAMKSGDLPTLRIGRSMFCPKQELRQLLGYDRTPEQAPKEPVVLRVA